MAKDRMPVWQSGMSWISDALADGEWWKKVIVYSLLLAIIGAVIGLLVLAFARGEADATVLPGPSGPLPGA